MADNLAPSPKVRMRGTSREYILDRLEREGHTDWIEAIKRDQISAHSVAVELGWVKRAPTLHGENSNQAKRRRHNLVAVRHPGGLGRRSMAWWKNESPIPWPGYDRERSALWEANLLTEVERTELEAGWRREFDRSLERGFSFDDDPRGVLTGRKAHIAHLVFHDVPADLCERWAAELSPSEANSNGAARA